MGLQWFDELLNLQAQLTSERRAAEEVRKAGADAEARNADLVKKLEDAEKKMDQLQESVQRFVNAYAERVSLSFSRLYHYLLSVSLV